MLAVLALLAAGGFAQTAQQTPSPQQQKSQRVVQSGAGYVGMDPKQPYRPIPLNRVEQRESIFSFYLRVMNPRQIRWGDEIKRRLDILSEQSVENPYFRLCAAQLALIIVLLTVSWLWWDKLHQVKWVASECLADAINARLMAELRTLDAIERHNRHMESCNRVVDGVTSAAGVTASGATITELQDDLVRAKAEAARLEAEHEQSIAASVRMEERLRHLEEIMNAPANEPNADLLARLARAEAQLAKQPPKRNSA